MFFFFQAEDGIRDLTVSSDVCSSDLVVGREAPEPIVAALAFFSPVVDRAMLAHALDRLIERALQHPRRIGWRGAVVGVPAELEHGASWVIAATLEDPTARPGRIAPALPTPPEPGAPARALVAL